MERLCVVLWKGRGGGARCPRWGGRHGLWRTVGWGRGTVVLRDRSGGMRAVRDGRRCVAERRLPLRWEVSAGAWPVGKCAPESPAGTSVECPAEARNRRVICVVGDVPRPAGQGGTCPSKSGFFGLAETIYGGRLRHRVLAARPDLERNVVFDDARGRGGYRACGLRAAVGRSRGVGVLGDTRACGDLKHFANRVE